MTSALQEYAGLASDKVPQLAGPEARVSSGEDALFAALVERQSPFIFRVVYVMLRSPQDAEDVVQETFMKLYRNGSWRGMRDERGFLARVAWRLSLDRLRSRKRSESEVSVRSGDGQIESDASDVDLSALRSGILNPEEAALSADWHATIHRLIDALPEELRQPLALSSVEEMDSREIARVMGISEGTVRTRLKRARSILKQKMAGLMEVRHGR